MSEELENAVKSHIIRVAGRGELTVIAVVKSILEESPELKNQAKTMMPLIKAEIANFEQQPDEEKEKMLAEEGEPPLPGGNEYGELLALLRDQLETSEQLKKSIHSLSAYGSYGKGATFYVPGQSDVNLLMVLHDESPANTSEILDEVIQPIVNNPIFSHLFDLVVLSENDLKSLNQLGGSFSAIHALSVRNCDQALLGENPLKDFEPSLEEIRYSARRLVQESCLRFGQALQQIREGGPGDEEDQMFIAGEAAISVALTLLYFVNGASETAVKTETAEKFMTLIEEDQTWSEYKDLLEWAHAIRIGVRLTKPEQLIEASGNFCRDVQVHMNAWASQQHEKSKN
ncbi:MAG: hypothetical protein ACXAEI_11625 [Candidatus Hodarchaeales archaeon]